MRKITLNLRTGILMIATAATLSSCIDEDMSDCGKDYQIQYNLQLNTQLNTTVDQELNLATEQGIANNLKQELGAIFSDHAKDNDLSFFTDEALSHHEANKMDANSVSYTIFLERNAYTNLALANTAAAANISIKGANVLNTLALAQEKKDTIDSHNIGLFSSRLNIQENDFDKNLKTTLYMANSASAVVIDKNNVQAEEIFGFVKGIADEFMVNDSIYHYDNGTVVRAKKTTGTETHESLYAVSFPSRDGYYIGNGSKATEEQAGIWEFHVIVKINGKYTENILSFPSPLKAGTLKIAKVTLQPDGSFHSNTQNVGVSVKLDWKPGGQHDIEI